MKPREDLLTLTVVLIVSCCARDYQFALDNKSLCQSDANIITRQMEDDDVIKIHGKIDESNNFGECVIKLGPSSNAKKQTTMIRFETFHINDCGTYLMVQQSPFQFFELDVSKLSTMFNFSCHSSPGKKAFYSESGNNIKIWLHKGSHLRNYNFIFNVTLTDYEPSKGISSAVIITIGVLVAIAIPGLGCIIYRYLKIKNWSKHQCEDEYSAQSVHGLSSLDPSFTPTSARYSSMPLGDGDTSNHVCVVGHQGSDGRCTVCNRSHEDFAHVVDLINDRPAPDDNSRRHPRHRDDYTHISDRTSSSSHTAPLIQQQDSRNVNIHRPDSHTHAPHGSGGGGARSRGGNNVWLNEEDIDIEEDIDLSGNDMVPPSYDLVPPSYEEAVGMPMPQGADASPAPVPPARPPITDPESDPLYQNVDSLNTDVR